MCVCRRHLHACKLDPKFEASSKETAKVRHDLRSAENIVCRECFAYWTDMSNMSPAPLDFQSTGILSPMYTLVSLLGHRLILMWVGQMLIAYFSHFSSSSFGATSRHSFSECALFHDLSVASFCCWGLKAHLCHLSAFKVPLSYIHATAVIRRGQQALSEFA